MSVAARRWLRRLLLWPLCIALVVVLYYAIGGHLAEAIDDDPAFAGEVFQPDGGSATVATMAALIEREVDTNGWVGNDPLIFPSGLLDDMAHYQRALIGTVRLTLDDVQRWTADAGPYPPIEVALGALAASDDQWTFDLTKSLRPQRTTEQFYREAADALERFNAELASGDAVLSVDAATLGATIRRFAEELDDAASAGLEHVRERGGDWLDTGVDDRFMSTKGVLYAQHALLTGFGRDFADALTGPDAAHELEMAQTALVSGFELRPWLVMNGTADGQFRPSHLAAQAAYTEQAAAALHRLAALLAGQMA